MTRCPQHGGSWWFESTLRDAVNKPTNKKGITMSTSKMSQIIRDVQTAAESVLNRSATNHEVIRVTEFIESLRMGNLAPKAAAVGTTTSKTKVQKPVKKANYPKKRAKPAVIVNWIQLKWWLNEILDGGQHMIFFDDLKRLMPIEKMRSAAFASRIRKEAQIRGFKTAHVLFEKRDGYVTIEATNN